MITASKAVALWTVMGSITMGLRITTDGEETGEESTSRNDKELA